jgi:F-type H+-transporting ATPase subunit alpha
LREILKQERLAPLSTEFHMALLIAFNDGHFDNIREHDAIDESLAALEAAVKNSPLTLDSPREQWAQAIAGWMSSAGEQHRDEKPSPA